LLAHNYRYNRARLRHTYTENITITYNNLYFRRVDIQLLIAINILGELLNILALIVYSYSSSYYVYKPCVYGSCKSTFLDGTDDNMFPYTLGWLGEMNAYGGHVTLNAFFHLCQHNCNLFKLAMKCINTPLKKRKICKISSEVSNII